MKIFLDTANLEKIKHACSLGIINGVTTNPSLVAKETDQKFEDIIKEICQLVKGPVHAEIISLKMESMVKEAEKIARIASNVVIKIPFTTEGAKAINALAKKKIKTNATLVFSSNQALLAAKAGAAYASPYLGRLDDIGHEGINLVAEILKIYQNFGYKTEVIAASIRHPKHVKEVALLGCHIATISPGILDKMFCHPQTGLGIKIFLNDSLPSTSSRSL